MPCIYSQRREDKHITMIGRANHVQTCKDYIGKYAMDWVKSKPGRKVEPLGSLEIGFLFSSGKLAATMWVETVVPPAGENPFTPATGEIPGLKV